MPDRPLRRRRLVLLRHGRTSWNVSGRAQGHADIELDAVGHEQAADVAGYLASLRPSALWSSDLARARQTCAYLEKETGLVAAYDGRLREFDVGRRQGLTLDEFAVRFPREHAAWRDGDRLVAVAQGESDRDVTARIVPAFREALRSLDPGEVGVVVTHGAALKLGLIGLLGWPISAYPSLLVMENCAYAVVEQAAGEPPAYLVSYNETTDHVRSLASSPDASVDFASDRPVG